MSELLNKRPVTRGYDKGAKGMKVNIDYEWIAKSIETIKGGFVKRLDNADKTIKVYQCGSIIRVDIKNLEEVTQ